MDAFTHTEIKWQTVNAMHFIVNGERFRTQPECARAADAAVVEIT